MPPDGVTARIKPGVVLCAEQESLEAAEVLSAARALASRADALEAQVAALRGDAAALVIRAGQMIDRYYRLSAPRGRRR